MNPAHLELGQEGEKVARSYLEKQGLLFKEANFRMPFGELDLIMQDRATWVFVEVRTKTDPDQVHPLESITPAKRGRVIKTAMAYMKKEGLYDQLCRFDVMALTSQSGGDWEIEHIENAFEVTGFS